MGVKGQIIKKKTPTVGQTKKKQHKASKDSDDDFDAMMDQLALDTKATGESKQTRGGQPKSVEAPWAKTFVPPTGEELLSSFSNLRMTSYFAGGANAMGLRWDPIALPAQELEDSYVDLVIKLLQDTKNLTKDHDSSQGPIGPEHPFYRVALAKEAIVWNEIELSFKTSAMRDLFISGAHLSTVKYNKPHLDQLQDVLLSASKKVMGQFMGTLTVAAAAWYQAYGEGSLCLEVEKWAHFVDPSAAAQKKCNVFIQWIPKASYKDFPEEFGSDSYLASVDSCKMGFNVVPRDGTGYQWNGLCIPYFPELLDLPGGKAFASTISACSDKCALGFSSMDLTSAVLLTTLPLSEAKRQIDEIIGEEEKEV